MTIRPTRTLALAAAALPLAFALPTVGATSASAAAPTADRASGVCDRSQAGDYRNVIGTPQKTYKIVASEQKELSRGATEQIEVTISETVTKENDVKLSSEVTASVEAGMFGGVEAKVGAELGTRNSKSVQRSRTVTKTINRAGKWIVAEGFVNYTVPVARQRCNRRNISDPGFYWNTTAKGHVKAFDDVSATYRCGDTPPKESFSGYLRQFKC